ncbi:MAG: LysM peptidoglycan-binding domain-containing protein, partial [Pseudomonadota bacterium]
IPAATTGDADETPAAPAVVEASDSGVRLLQPAGLAAVDGVTLDSVSYARDGAVVLAGRAPEDADLRVYADGRALGDVKAGQTGSWDARLDDLAEGVYTLRIDQIDDTGAVLSRIESPFQRVFPSAEILDRPTSITVQPGNTLWVMARDRYGSGFEYTQIYAANSNLIRDPDLIYPGQIFTLPKDNRGSN